MTPIQYENHIYHTDPLQPTWLARTLPSISFYLPFMRVIIQASGMCKKGLYNRSEWCVSSLRIFRQLENIGARLEITGLEHLEQLDGPCVIISNHMSLLETVILPCIVQSVRDVTFVVKQSLLEYPVFKHIMRFCDPVAVSRTNPREDFKAVMTGGKARLEENISIIVFPQTTRTVTFDPEQFNTIGVKLAQKGKVPIIPLALKTDAWGNGKVLKDFGRIDIGKTVHFAFGAPIQVQGRGSDEHQQVIDFIQQK
ncbi:MAG: 1-acyl-sn-glycerol-3-phosphate acyltransferase, partial [Planctomycetes bacterium]|nr:1-acyl-sn-glycerol-3-phosphate acyltransferase [Planctomycetota bacterium]